MAAVCDVCGKHPSFGMAVSHSHRRTKRRWNPNIQRVRAVVERFDPARSTPAPRASRPARSPRSPTEGGEQPTVQGVIKSYDPASRMGVVVRDTDLAEYDLAAEALEGSVFRMVRQGQRVVFDLTDDRTATRLRLGSEVDMGTPGFPVEHPGRRPAPPGLTAGPAAGPAMDGAARRGR